MSRVAMTAQRRAVFARQAWSRFAKGEAELRPHVEQAINDYLSILRKHAARSKVLTAAAPVDDGSGDDFTDEDAAALLDELDQGGLFGDILDRTIMPALKAQLIPILQAGMARPGVQDSLVTWRNDWLASRRQELVNIPDSITSQLRTQLEAAAATRGTSVSDASWLVQNMLDNGYPSWANRADLIARTETVGANNQGSLASMSAIADSENMAGEKTWLATEDSLTRQDHVDVDGTTVGLSEMFDVGGDEMNGPGDPAGGAAQVCNCRCTLTYAFPDVSTSGDNSGDNGGSEADQTEADLTDQADTNMTAAAAESQINAGLTAFDSREGLGAPAAAAQTGVAVMLGLGAGDDSALRTLPGVPTPDPPGFHCTLAYLAEPATSYTPQQQAALITALSMLKPEITADAFATAHFNPASDEREPCAVLLVQSEALSQIHEQVAAALTQCGLAESDTFPIWIPHVAVAYGSDPSVIPDSMLGEISFNRLIVGWGGQQIVAAGDGALDSPGDTGSDAMTAATEAPVTAPSTAPAPEATGGDTPAESVPPEALEPEGITWSGPIALLDTPSSDGRVISSTGGTVRPLPQPLKWQEKDAEFGHVGAVMVGRILAVEIRGSQLWASGDWLDPNLNFDAAQAMAQVDAGMGFISVDLAVHEIGYADAETGAPVDPALMVFDADIAEVALTWELGGATILSFASFADARITNEVPALPGTTINPAPTEAPIVSGPSGPAAFAGATPEKTTISDDGTSVALDDGSTAGVGDPVAWTGSDGATATGVISEINATDNTVSVTPDALSDGTQPPDMTLDVGRLIPVPDEAGKPGMDGSESALLASSEIRPYTAKHFRQHTLPGPTPLTVNAETGEVFGHLATWGECHTGKIMEGKCVTAPPAPGGDYSYFHLAPVQTDEGLLDVGKITLGAGHAGRGGMRAALAHYDNTATAVAVVRAYEDDYGIQIAGQLIHDTPAAKIEELMRSPISGDWRGLDGHLRLVAALAVNTPGFPVRRPVVGMSGDSQISLVAAGVLEIPEGRSLHEITLPSGRTIGIDDFQALTAAAIEVMNRKPIDTEDELAIRRARLRVDLAARRNRSAG